MAYFQTLPLMLQILHVMNSSRNYYFAKNSLCTFGSLGASARGSSPGSSCRISGVSNSFRSFSSVPSSFGGSCLIAAMPSPDSSGFPLIDGFLSGICRFFLFLRVTYTAMPAPASTATTPKATPTPIPTLAPLESPLVGCLALVGELPVLETAAGGALVAGLEVLTANEVLDEVVDVVEVVEVDCPGPSYAPQAVGTGVCENCNWYPGGPHPTPLPVSEVGSCSKHFQPFRQQKPSGALFGEGQ